MRFIVGLLFAPAVWPAADYFPAVGGSSKQTIAIRIIALGTKDSAACPRPW